ncbi:hypothetical protein, partial [Modestobacter versicolor]
RPHELAGPRPGTAAGVTPTEPVQAGSSVPAPSQVPDRPLVTPVSVPPAPAAPSDGSRSGGALVLATLPAPPVQPSLADLVSSAPLQTLQDGSDTEPSVSPA